MKPIKKVIVMQDITSGYAHSLTHNLLRQIEDGLKNGFLELVDSNDIFETYKPTKVTITTREEHGNYLYSVNPQGDVLESYIIT